MSSLPLDTLKRAYGASRRRRGIAVQSGADPSWTGRWTGSLGPTHTTQILTLLLALSGAVNVAFAAAITARAAGATPAQAILTGAGSAGMVMGIFFAAIAAYQ